MRSQMLTTGGWRLATDPENIGRDRKWYERVQPQTHEAPVPGIIQQVFPGYHGAAWYWLAFKPDIASEGNERVHLRFGAVDYLAEVWLNGRHVGGHEGGETPFTLDITEAFKAGQENLVAVRVLNPTDAPIEGITLMETPHSQKGNSACGGTFNPGGIVLPVELAVVPPVRITDVFAAPDIPSGEVHLSVTIRNDTSDTIHGMLSLAIGPDKTGEVVIETRIHLDLAAGESTRDAGLTIPQPRLWNLDDPFLYRVHAVLTAPSCHEQSVRFGFRDFRVKDGFFFLNGRRIFLRSNHTGPWFPVVQTGPDLGLMRRDMLYSKACGFNCVRFLSKMPLPEQLDIADEIGIMVYAESYAGWWHLKEAEVKDPEKVKQRFAAAIREMILRDRNHPSLTIWGLLNEVPAGLITRQAAASLPLIRSLDKTRLVLLQSGRWDRQLDIGSLSNPESTEWEYQWGIEGKNAKARQGKDGVPNHRGEGDCHYYPPTPLSNEVCHFLRTLGSKTKPVFLSEGGIGSLLNAIQCLRKYEEKGVERKDLEDRAFFQSICDKLTSDWHRFKMESAYPFPEDMLLDSQRVHLRQRRRWFDLLRSNPNLCGHSLTSMLDFTSGEGFWDCWRDMKPGIADVLRDGWAPLRWCLFANPIHGYSGRPLHLEAVLANEDVLKPGKYPVTFRIWGREGVAWEKKVTMNLPARGKNGLPPLAVPVLDETLKLKVPAGEYTFAACLERGGAPAGNRMKFFISEAAALPRPMTTVTVWGIEPSICRWLNRHGVRTRPFRPGEKHQREVIIVGMPPMRLGYWHAMLRRMSCGASAVFMNADLFRNSHGLPMTRKGRFVRCMDWLYHKEAVAKAHPIFDGLPAPGILDWDYYDEVAGRHVLFDADVPDETIVAGFAVGLTQLSTWTDWTYAAGGVMVGEYRFGAGRFIVSGLGVLPQIDRHPAADRLLLNFVRHAATLARKSLAKPPAGFEDLEDRVRTAYPFMSDVIHPRTV